METCPLPTTNIAEMDFGSGVAILLDDGPIHGWKHGLPTTEDDCIYKPASDAYTVELVVGQLVVDGADLLTSARGVEATSAGRPGPSSER